MGDRPAVAVVVQHHPARAHLIEPLLSRLGEAQVVTDPNPDSPKRSALRTYLECIRRAPECDHLLIVQDDAYPCDDFSARARAFIADWPEHLCALFVPGTGHPGGQVRRALKRDLTVAHIGLGWTPTVALSWPYEAAQAFLAYAEGRYDVESFAGDDAPVGSWRRESRVQCVAPVPSLVEHPDVEPSLVRPGKAGRAGRNRARVARAFAG